jgi:hypothetical protein
VVVKLKNIATKIVEIGRAYTALSSVGYERLLDYLDY